MILLACSQKDDHNLNKIDDVERSMNDTGTPINELINEIEWYGSVSAFNELQIQSLDYRAGEFLGPFMIMADKFNNAEACMQVYYEIVYMYETPQVAESLPGIFIIDSLNPDARKMVIQYLEKADSLGNDQAKTHLLEYKKLGVIL